MLPRNVGAVPAITNPLTIYRSLLATNKIVPDPSQHRLAIHLQKLYFRLIDYSPQVEYAERLKAIYRVVSKSSQIDQDKQLAAPGHPLRQNPLFARFFPKENRESLALTRVLTNYEEAINLQSPQGLLVHGEVGSGKSMLVDLLADGLPNRKKKRWHFNTFMLEVLAKLEQFRRTRHDSGQDDANSDHSLLRLAKDMIEDSAILFLDEFQLPDKAASKILSQLLTAFFHLGGVLIATSNRMPDELSKASGIDFANYPRGKKGGNLLGFGGKAKLTTSYTNQEYAGFVEVLKARCEIWNMEGERDWRRREAELTDTQSPEKDSAVREKGTVALEQSSKNSDPNKDQHDSCLLVLPKMYILNSPKSNDVWQLAIRSSLQLDTTNLITWEKKNLSIYAREVIVPRQLNGVSYWTFSELCGSFFGPADYITLASTFHTFILDEVPIITVLQKNEARRFITLLDALYEARCKLLVRAEAGPDDIFFPEASSSSEDDSRNTENDSSNAVYSETLSEIYQDQVLPFRPNISSYTDGDNPAFRSELGSSVGQKTMQNNGIQLPINFTLTSSFTGEDERFAYKRARSRLWEMCGAKWHVRSESGWWQPLPVEIRRWERSILSTPTSNHTSCVKNDVKMGEFIELDSPAGLQGIELKNEAACTGSCSKHSS